MSKKPYLITWNVGYGDDVAVVLAESNHDAEMQAYQRWREAAEDNADYSARPYDKEEADGFRVGGEPHEGEELVTDSEVREG